MEEGSSEHKTPMDTAEFSTLCLLVRLNRPSFARAHTYTHMHTHPDTLAIFHTS